MGVVGSLVVYVEGHAFIDTVDDDLEKITLHFWLVALGSLHFYEAVLALLNGAAVATHLRNPFGISEVYVRRYVRRRAVIV